MIMEKINIAELLKDYTTEELRAELRRRTEIIKAEKANIMRCKQCKFYGKITYYGKDVDEFTDTISRLSSRSCKFHKTKNGKYYKVHQPYQIACEHFESISND